MVKPINLCEYETFAAKRLSKVAFDYIAGGAGDERTLNRNREAFSDYRLHPKVLVDVKKRDLSTQIFGQNISFPVIIAPTAFHCLAHPDGELATVKAAEKIGTTMVLSTMSTKSLEEVAIGEFADRSNNAVPNRSLWFQLYVHRDRGLTRTLVERAQEAGYQALCLTVDAPVLGLREREKRNQFGLPSGMQLANLTTLGKHMHPLTDGNYGLLSYFAEQIDPGLSWDDLSWLRSITDLPIVVKGILRADDALKAVSHGAHGIVVSNHGGRQLDGVVASIDALSEVAIAVEGRVEVLMDGGIRRGTDVLTALALGAKAVLLGRPIFWGLAWGGESGVYSMLKLLMEEFDTAMALSGCSKVIDIDASLVQRPGNRYP